MNGYQRYREFLGKVPAELKGKHPVKTRANTDELQLLINGRNSTLDIKNMIDPKGQIKAELRDVLNYLEILKAAGLVEIS